MGKYDVEFAKYCSGECRVSIFLAAIQLENRVQTYANCAWIYVDPSTSTMADQPVDAPTDQSQSEDETPEGSDETSQSPSDNAAETPSPANEAEGSDEAYQSPSEDEADTPTPVRCRRRMRH